MSQHIEGPRKTFTAGSALEAFRRVKVTAVIGDHGPTVGYAGASDPSIGVTEEYTASGAPVTIYLANAQGTRKMMATAAAITGNNPVYAAANGYVAATGTVVEGKALETTAGASGDILEVLPVHNSDISTAIAGTTAAAFEIDSDSTTPKIALASQAAGTGDFTTTLKPEATLSADNAIIVPESDGDTLACLALAQTFTARQGFTGNTANTAGVGITGAAESFVASVTKEGTVFKTTIVIDLTGLYCGGSAGDIIGANGAGAAHLGQITAAVNGTIVAGRLTCLETPTGGDTDIDLYSATEATGVEDTAIGDLAETQLVNSGGVAAGNVFAIVPPAADKYLYLVGQGTGNTNYTAGKLLIELWGK